MKFLRHLAAVVLVVALIVGLGMLWAHAAGGGAGHALRRAPSPQAVQRLQQIKAGVIRVQSDDGFNLADSGNLIRTCEIEAVLAAVVITVSAVRRRRRRMRRNAASAEPGPPGPLAAGRAARRSAQRGFEACEHQHV